MCRTVLQKTWRSSRLEVFKCFSTQKRCYVACILQMEGTFGKPRHNKHFVGRVTDVLDTSGERSARVSLQAAAVELSSRYWQQTSYLRTHTRAPRHTCSASAAAWRQVRYSWSGLSTLQTAEQQPADAARERHFWRPHQPALSVSNSPSYTMYMNLHSLQTTDGPNSSAVKRFSSKLVSGRREHFAARGRNMCKPKILY